MGGSLPSGVQDRRRALRRGLVGGAFLMLVVGALVFLMIDRVAGIVIGALGAIDLLTAFVVLRATERRDDANPYARED